MSVPFPFHRVSATEKAFFASQLATMLDAGLHITQALALLANQTKNQYLKEIIAALGHNIEVGKPFSAGLALYPNVFDGVFVSMVRSGEVSGRLAQVLQDVGQQLERSNQFNSKIRAALAYPTFVVIVMVGVALITSIKIIPSLKGIFTEANIALPWTTQVVLKFSDILQRWWWLIILVIAALVVGWLQAMRTKTGKELLDRALLYDPTKLSQKIYLARFARMLGSLTRAGIPIITALKLAADVIGNEVYARSLRTAAGQIERGVPLSIPLGRDSNFPPFVTQMVAVGETTGRLDQTLLNLAEYYERQVDDSIKNISALFEPVVIVLIALGVAFLVFAIIVPIYSISQAI